jgi:hypothetical protein
MQRVMTDLLCGRQAAARLLAVILAGCLLQACAQLRPSLTDCNDRITAAADGARVNIRTVEQDQPVEARLNGVDARCYDRGGATVMQVKIGLKVIRDLAVNSEVIFLEVPVISAVLDGADKPVSQQSESFRMAFPASSGALYPVVETEMRLPLDGRAVISLSPQRL